MELKSSKPNQLTNDSYSDESFVIVEEPKEDCYDQNLEEQGTNESMEQENEHQDLLDVLQEKINEINNVVELQHSNASDFYPCKLQEVLLIGNHNDIEDTLIFHFLDGQNMAKVVGVGLDYGQVILRNGVDVEIHEASKVQWEKAWLDSKSVENTTYKTMKVRIPFSNDIGTPNVNNIMRMKILYCGGPSYGTLLDTSRYAKPLALFKTTMQKRVEMSDNQETMGKVVEVQMIRSPSHYSSMLFSIGSHYNL